MFFLRGLAIKDLGFYICTATIAQLLKTPEVAVTATVK